jgi:hypothetical protein
MPRSITARRISDTLNLDSGSPCSCGRSHANALTAITTLGGKAGWSPVAWLLFEAKQTQIEKALSPFANDLSGRIQPSRDFVIMEPLCGV